MALEYCLKRGFFTDEEVWTEKNSNGSKRVRDRTEGGLDMPQRGLATAWALPAVLALALSSLTGRSGHFLAQSACRCTFRRHGIGGSLEVRGFAVLLLVPGAAAAFAPKWTTTEDLGESDDRKIGAGKKGWNEGESWDSEYKGSRRGSDKETDGRKAGRREVVHETREDDLCDGGDGSDGRCIMEGGVPWPPPFSSKLEAAAR